MIPDSSVAQAFVVCGLLCIFWMLLHTLLANRLSTFKLLEWLLLTILLTTAGDTLLRFMECAASTCWLVLLLSAPSVIPLTWLYLAYLNPRFQFRPVHVIWIVIPAILFTAGFVMVILSEENSPYYSCVEMAAVAMMALEALCLLVYCGVLVKRYHMKPCNWWGFLFKGRKIRVLEVQMTLSLLILAGLSIKLFFYQLRSSLAWPLVLLVALLLFLLGLFALFGSREFITAQDLSTLLRLYSFRESQPKGSDEAELAGTPSISSALLGNAKNWEDGSLVTRFQHLMQDEELFLQPGLTLGDVATRLDSNKTYISKMVNQTYGVGFPELLNIMRVDYAELYIRKNKDASQEEIAKASGFLSASSFNSTFKRITGYTPKVWASRKA